MSNATQTSTRVLFKKDIGRPIDVKSYIEQMRDAIGFELKAQGQCWLIEYVLQRNTDRLHFLDYAAIKMAYKTYITHEKADAIDELTRMQKVWRVRGIDYEIPIIDDEIKDNCLILKGYGLGQYNSVQNRENLKSTEDALRREKEALQRHKEDWQMQRETLQHQLDAERKALFEQEAQAKHAIEAATLERETIREKANAMVEEEKTKILEEARQTLERARSEARELIAQAQEDARHEARGIRDEILKESDDERLQREYSKIRSDICEDTQSMQFSMIDALTKTVNDLEALLSQSKGDMVFQMDKWRRSLYEVEYQSLASFYCNLYRFINGVMDRDIRLQVEKDAGVESPETERMKRHQSSLIRYLASLDRILCGFGLSFIRPQKGEDYDEYLHAADEEDISAEAKVARYSCPGIRMGEDGKVLLRADVSLENSTDKPNNDLMEGTPQ